MTPFFLVVSCCYCGAGSDTTAGSMSAALFEITRNATILNTVLEELKHWDPNEPSHTTVAGMQQR